MKKAIPIMLEPEEIRKLDIIARQEVSSRNRLLRIAIKNFLETNQNAKRK